MALVNFTNLDFDQIKSSIVDYLKSNSDFTDYNFEGSNLSAIIDVLAYNTYISSYNANMLSNEVFIDSATLRENVVSLARNIGYVPRSRTAARANVSFFVDTSSLTNNPVTITLRKGIVCTTTPSFGSENYTFSIPQDITVPVVNNIASFDNVKVYEGTYLTQNFTVNVSDVNQKFILDNANIDTSLITVTVRDTEASTATKTFTLSNSILNVTSTSKIFFIQEIDDQRYELIFGDEYFGQKLENLNYITANYVVTNGPAANGASSFTFNGRLVDNNGNVVTSDISLITTNISSQGGKEIESVNSIKNYAPKVYSTQNRAVTSADYQAIIPQIYPEAESVSVFGGEELNPPKYGKVFITIKPYNGSFIPNFVKDNIKRSLRTYSVAGIVTEILDLKYLYIEFNSSVYYNSNLSSSSDALRSRILNNTSIFASSPDMNKYGAKFKYSKFLKLIDDASDAITSNITTITIRRDVSPEINKFVEYSIKFGNQIHIENNNGFNIKSSGFSIAGVTNTVYISDIPNTDLKTGKIIFFTLQSETQFNIVRTSAGTINYETGDIKLSAVNIISTSKLSLGNPIIQVSATPKSNDVVGLQDLYLSLDINNSTVNMISDTISSGADVSGSTYTSTSSYSNGNLVRL